MNYSIYFLKKLDLKPSDLEILSEDEKTQKIRLQWMSLCLQAEDADQASEHTRSYHYLISDDSSSHPINSSFERQTLILSNTTFDLTQREQIKKSYQDLLVEFSQLTTVEEKQNFARQNANFINLAQSLERSQRDFNECLGQLLYLQQKKTLQLRIIQQWRLQMIRLFGIEGLDDFQYRHALATGELRAILATDKLLSPLKLLVGGINSIILVITTTFDFILSYHPYLRIGFFFLLSHPLAMLMVQLPRIAKMLEMLACPTNQIIRPICAYTHWSPQSITLLLSATALAVLYAALYTSLLANLPALLPYIATGLFAYFLYSMGKQCFAFFKKSFAEGMIFTATIVALFTVQAYVGLMLNSGQTLNSAQTPSISKQWLKMLSLFSLITLLTNGSQNMALSIDMLPLPFPNDPIPETIRDTVRTRCDKANLSHRFFNTPKDAPAIPREQLEESGSSVWGWLHS